MINLLQVPFRDDFIFIPEWMKIILYLAFTITFVTFVYGIYVKTKPIGLKNLLNVFLKSFNNNVKFTLTQWLMQRRLISRRYSGFMHWGIFFGSFVLFIGTIIVFIDIDIIQLAGYKILQGGSYLAFEMLLDLFGILFIAGLILAIIRRTILKPSYLETRRWDYIILFGLLFMGLSGFIMEGLRLALKPVPWEAWSFVGNQLGYLFAAAKLDQNGVILYQSIWLTHAAVTFLIAVAIPFSSLFHIIVSSANVLLSKNEPIGQLSTPFDLKEITESGNFDIKIGFNNIQDLPWEKKLSLLACTNCGRCQNVCPATASGRSLNPRLVIQNLRNLLGDTSMYRNLDLAQNVVSTEEIWGCTMCGACVQQCPVLIRKPDYLIDLRRHLIANGMADSKMNLLLTNLQTHGNPYGARSHDRVLWLKDLNVKTLDEDPNVEYLYWVGCTAAFDLRAQSIAKSMITLLQKAGVSFGVLGMKEKCTGEVVRRLGEESLFQQMAMDNIEILNGYGVKKIITHCPHCYNTFKNEYPQFGGSYTILHHTEILSNLLKAGKFNLRTTPNLAIGMHDSCYLGRYNGIYNEPRSILNSLNGVKPVDVRAKEESFCCGAGGANFWYKVNETTRIPDLRLDEFTEAGAKTVVTECPFCLSMFEESLKANDEYQELEIKDISELLLSALETEHKNLV